MHRPRACRTDEFDEVISLINKVFRDNSTQDIRTDYPLIFHPSKVDLMRIIKINGDVVSHVPIAPREVLAMNDSLSIGIISPTVTHPDHRRRGYGTLCLQDCIRIMETRSWPVSVLWTAEATFPFYRDSGWEAVNSQGNVYFLMGEDSKLFQSGDFGIMPYDPVNHLAVVAAIHDTEPYRIRRSRRDYMELFNLPKTRTLVATAAERVTAYLMVSDSSNKPGIIESGGDRKCVEALVNFVLSRLKPNCRLQVPLPLTPTAMGTLLETKLPHMAHPVEEAEGVGHQMMRINDLRVFFQQIEGYLRTMSQDIDADLTISCTDNHEPVTLSLHKGQVEISSKHDADSFSFSRRELTQIIFGNHNSNQSIELSGLAREILPQLFPFYFPVWELDHS